MRSVERCCGAASSSVGTTTQLPRGFRPREVENGLLHACDLLDVDDLARLAPYGDRIVVRSCASRWPARARRRALALPLSVPWGRSPSLSTRTIACARRGTRIPHSRTIERRSASVDAVGPCVPHARRRSHTPEHARSSAVRDLVGEGVSVPRGGAFWRSKRLGAQRRGSQRVSQYATTSGMLATCGRQRSRAEDRAPKVVCDGAPARYIFGSNMMCAFGVPGNISHGVPSAGFTESPVVAAVAPGRYTM